MTQPQADTPVMASGAPAGSRRLLLIGSGSALVVLALAVFLVLGRGNTGKTPSSDTAARDAALERARTFSGTNDDWQPFYWIFEDGVEMALVPTGCFMMGLDDGTEREQPAHEQCIDSPFWIDRTEVTQGDFARLGGVQAEPSVHEGADRPVERLTWFNARDFCARRGARLPTERDWEYAARGPSNWIYPWGNEWSPENVVWEENSNGQTAPVGSYLAGASWVGALDMSGNVLEWTSSLDEPYPYDAGDGREADTGDNLDVRRITRSHSYITDETFLRASVRLYFEPNLAGSGVLGVRCVRDVGDGRD